MPGEAGKPGLRGGFSTWGPGLFMPLPLSLESPPSSTYILHRFLAEPRFFLLPNFCMFPLLPKRHFPTLWTQPFPMKWVRHICVILDHQCHWFSQLTRLELCRGGALFTCISTVYAASLAVAYGEWVR